MSKCWLSLQILANVGECWQKLANIENIGIMLANVG
jgi:hypothetical protein